jgi:hypothetical protein
MRTLLGVLLLVVPQSDDVDGLDAKEKWSAGYAEKTWGLTVKSVKRDQRRPDQRRVVFEFGKDLKPEELAALRASIISAPKGPGAKLEFQFFDADGVVAYRSNKYEIEGELTGTKGDAFRAVVLTLNSARPAVKIMKVELRMPVQYQTPPTAPVK